MPPIVSFPQSQPSTLTRKQLNRTLRTLSLDSVGGSQLLEIAPRVQVISGHCARHRHMMPWLCENCGDSPQEDEKRLVTAQRLWIEYRDANCTAERELYAGGTAATPVYLACLEAMTRARTNELWVTYAVRLK